MTDLGDQTAASPCYHNSTDSTVVCASELAALTAFVRELHQTVCVASWANPTNRNPSPDLMPLHLPSRTMKYFGTSSPSFLMELANL